MSIEIIDILKPKNGLSFKLIEDIDIAVQGYTSLADAVSHFATKEGLISAINTALSGKQDKLTTEQLAACNSGITSQLVAQISLNASAIADKADASDLTALETEIDGKADASDLTTATASLQAQIDAIITPATQDAEVENARVGTDGTVYNTLKGRLDAENTSISASISSLNGKINSILGETDIAPDMTDDYYYYNTSGNTIGYDSQTGVATSYSSAKSDNWCIAVQAGEIYKITSMGSASGAYAFISGLHSTYADVDSRYGVNEQITNAIVTIPSGITYLIVNNYNVGNASVTKLDYYNNPIVRENDLASIEQDLSTVQTEIQTILNAENITINPTMANNNYYYNFAGNTILYDPQTGISTSYSNAKSDNWSIPVTAGETYKITAQGAQSGTYAFVGELHPTYADISARYGANEYLVDELVQIPVGVTYLLINNWDLGNGSVIKIETDPLVHESDFKVIQDTVKPCIANYVSESTQLDIYLPCSVGYVKMPLAHRTDLTAGHNYNVWHIQDAKAVNDSLESRYNLTSTGEWECAIRLAGRPDYMGGTNHGNEKTISSSIFVNGEKINDISTIANQKFDELKFIDISEFYDPDDEVTKVATHSKEYIFTRNGLEIKQAVNWLANETVRESFMCMMPIADYTTSAMTNLVTRYGYANDDFIEYDLFNDDTDAIHDWKRNRTEITVYGVDKGLTVTTQQIKQDSNAGVTHGDYACIYSTMAKSGSNGYNKHYYMIAGNNADDTVEAGDRWYTDYIYKFSIGK